jgi:hypothetical protein
MAQHFDPRFKILFFDTEISTFQLTKEVYSLKNYNKYEDHNNITRDWVMFGAAWAVNNGKIESAHVDPKKPYDDKKVVKALHDAVYEADAICGHNMAAFDIKKLNTRAIKLGLPPIGKKIVLDTLKVARSQFDFPSASLAYLAKDLGVAPKDASPDWQAIHEGDEKAIKYMDKYCKRDVKVLREIYLKFRGWWPNHPDMRKLCPIRDVSGNIIQEQCPSCGGLNTTPYGSQLRANNTRVVSMRCKDCGRRFPAKNSKS